MFDPSPTDNAEVYACYVEAKEKLKQAAIAAKELEAMLKDKFMAISKTDRQLIENSITDICSASWGLKIQGVRIKQARAKSRIMSHCGTVLAD